MKTLRLLFIAFVLFAVGCADDDECLPAGKTGVDPAAQTDPSGKNDPEDPGDDPSKTPADSTSQVETKLSIIWESITQFNMSEVSRVDVTTEIGTQPCTLTEGQMTIPYAFTNVDSVRVYIPSGQGSIRLGPQDFTYENHVITVTLNLLGFTFVPDRASLDAIRNSSAALCGHYLQTADIDLAGADWSPITPEWSISFRGVYDGNGFTISHMNIDAVESSINHILVYGLFGTNKGTICNVHLEDCHIKSVSNTDVYCAGLSVFNDGLIYGCTFDGTLNVKGRMGYVGGVCACNNSGVIFMCSNRGSIHAEVVYDCYVGGVCGANEKQVISSFNAGSIEASGSNVDSKVICGGVVGRNISTAEIAASYNSNTNLVSSEQSIFAGSLIGWNESSANTVSYCNGVSNGQVLNVIGRNDGSANGLAVFGNGASCWPDASLPGWGDVRPDCWNESVMGAWTNPWSSLGAWNGGVNPVYPTLK